MTQAAQRPSDTYAPLYFLASVGAGGIAVSFFMWLMHWVPHPGQPVPVFEDIHAAFMGGGALMRGMIVAAVAGIAIFAVMNLRLLVWNLRRYAQWQRSPGFESFSKTNAQSQLLALPLALAMAINVLFILGMVFVPGLWSVVEMLFPLAMIAFLAIGVLAFRLYARFLGRVLTEGGFSCAANNNFGQVLPAFAFAMVGVGLAAPAALSTVPALAGLGLILSSFFLMTAALIAVVAMVLGFRAMMEHGANPETAPTLSIIVPLIAVLGILSLRQSHGMEAHFGAASSAGDSLVTLTRLLSVQVLFLLFAGLILIRQGYAQRFIFGRENSPGSYALVCPGVGFAVLLHFFVNNGLVEAGLIAQFGLLFWAVTALALVSQAAMIWLVLRLNRRHFGAPRPTDAVPAE